MKVGLFGAVFVALVLRANCGNDDEMRAKLEVMERHLARMDAMEKRLAKMDAMEERQQAKMDAMEKHLAKMDAMAKCQEVMEKRLVEMDAMEKRQEIIEKREEVTNKRLAAVEQQHAPYPISFFSVQLSEDLQVAHGGTVVFDSVVVNYGSDYIQTGGIYIAPEDGYYMFTLVVREDGSVHCAGSVMRTPASDPNNAVMLCRAEVGDNGWQTASCTVITQLLAGDQVYVIAEGYWTDEENSFYLSHGYTSFTGVEIRSGLE